MEVVDLKAEYPYQEPMIGPDYQASVPRSCSAARNRREDEKVWCPKSAAKESVKVDAYLARVREALRGADGLQPSAACVEESALQVLHSLKYDAKAALAALELCVAWRAADAKKVREDAVRLENEMNAARNKLDLKYVEADGTVVDATPTVLRTKIRSAADESVRESCWRATRTVGPFLLDNGFPKIIAERNRFARTLGFVDFYDMKVTQAEGFSKRTCFEMLDGLEAATRPLLEEALAKLEAEKGADARKPWNLAYALSGELTRELDPYFPFENAPLVWGRSFAKMGIAYRGTTMRLDLCDRKGKYPNGFCHWPVAPHLGSDGEWHASRANFTSLATPDEVGSGNTALTTLMHEGGHAAHFANIVQGSPVFAQERI